MRATWNDMTLWEPGELCIIPGQDNMLGMVMDLMKSKVPNVSWDGIELYYLVLLDNGQEHWFPWYDLAEVSD